MPASQSHVKRATHPDRSKSNNEGHNIRQHVKGVCDEGNGVGDVANNDLHKEEGGRQPEHRQQTTCLGSQLTHLLVYCQHKIQLTFNSI